MPFTFKRLALAEVILVTPRAHSDARGFFRELYKRSEFSEGGIPDVFVQTNHSRSTLGVLRGLHYQIPPQAQGKLISVVRGAVFDVAVDIRKGSPTYGKWVGEVLSDENHRLLYVPEGFAHGFCVLSEVVDLCYQVTAEFAPDLDRGILWNDPQIGVAWPVADPQLSAKDAAQPLLAEADNAFVYPGR